MNSLLARIPGMSRREAGRFVRFGIVGISGFVVDFTVLSLLMTRAHWVPWLANTCSFALAVSDTFLWNRLWTFPESRSRSLGRQMAQFLLINIIGLGINQTVFLGSHALLWTHLIEGVWAYYLAKATASGVALFWNFGANRLWTWRGIAS